MVAPRFLIARFSPANGSDKVDLEHAFHPFRLQIFTDVLTFLFFPILLAYHHWLA